MAISTIGQNGLTVPLTSNTITSASATALTLQSAGTTAVTIDTSQNVGIGITSPTRKLQVKGGTIGVTSNDGTVTNVMDYSSIGTATNSAFTLVTNGSDRVTIDTSGNLLVGATSIPSAISSSKVYVSGAYGAQQTYGPMYYSNENNTDNVGRSSFSFYRGGTLVGQITTTNSTCGYTSVSDYRLKENIAPITGALDKVSQLKPCTYKWKSNGFDGQGFIAHELQAVVPDCVTGEKDAVDADGNPVYQGIDTSFLVATLTAALQETKALIDQQAETINALTARVVALESK